MEDWLHWVETFCHVVAPDDLLKGADPRLAKLWALLRPAICHYLRSTSPSDAVYPFTRAACKKAAKNLMAYAVMVEQVRPCRRHEQCRCGSAVEATSCLMQFQLARSAARCLFTSCGLLCRLRHIPSSVLVPALSLLLLCVVCSRACANILPCQPRGLSQP